MIERTASKRNFRPLAAALAVPVLMILALRFEGRIWWCKLGDYSIYVNEAWNSGHTSQHLFDPYTFTHVLHGVLFCWLAGLIFYKLSAGWRFFVAVLAESAWEILENSNFIIEKYRENTASLDYFGDSVFNSLGDVAACALGFWIALRLGWWKSLAFFLLVEIILLVWIRDGLLLNILMLVYPLDAVKRWQMNF
ncbi:MAG: DUF2585 family protein [Acidobacteria bacterium]|nr:DUF2585 family protein [Acidobacteriota bacterium]